MPGAHPPTTTPTTTPPNSGANIAPLQRGAYGIIRSERGHTHGQVQQRSGRNPLRPVNGRVVGRDWRRGDDGTRHLHAGLGRSAGAVSGADRSSVPAAHGLGRVRGRGWVRFGSGCGSRLRTPRRGGRHARQRGRGGILKTNRHPSGCRYFLCPGAASSGLLAHVCTSV